MVQFSSNQLDQIATHLEQQSSDPRHGLEDYVERITTALETLSNQNIPVTGGYAQRIVNAINNLSFNPSPVVGALDVIENGEYLAEEYGYSGFNCVNVNVSGSSTTYIANHTRISQAFNLPVVINEGVMDCYATFSGCTNFNQPVTIPNSVETSDFMFADCMKFNQPVDLSNTWLKYGNSMFLNCANFNQDDIHINTQYRGAYYNMFKGVQRIGNIYLEGSLASASNLGGFVNNRYQNSMVNIILPNNSFGTNMFNNIRLNTGSSSVVGASITWDVNSETYTEMHNTAYNVYVYVR